MPAGFNVARMLPLELLTTTVRSTFEVTTEPQLLVTSHDTVAEPAAAVKLYMCSVVSLWSMAVALADIVELKSVMGSCTDVAAVFPVGVGFGAQPNCLASMATSSCCRGQQRTSG
jgi:hypothetical protein